MHATQWRSRRRAERSLKRPESPSDAPSPVVVDALWVGPVRGLMHSRPDPAAGNSGTHRSAPAEPGQAPAASSVGRSAGSLDLAANSVMQVLRRQASRPDTRAAASSRSPQHLPRTASLSILRRLSGEATVASDADDPRPMAQKVAMVTAAADEAAALVRRVHDLDEI